jgi:hypothetical protein
MVFNYTAKPEIDRHSQDTFTTFCGRACAQMVIAALTRAPGATPTSELPVTQEVLFNREFDHSPETSSDTNRWFTHPNEMWLLLKDSPELQGVGLAEWRLAAYPMGENLHGAKRLLADVVMTLQKEAKPAAVTVGKADHWILVVGVRFNSSEGLMFEIQDPTDGVLPPPIHHYVDACNTDGNGRTYVVAEPHDGEGFLRMRLDVASRTKPAGLPNYGGSCVGILCGEQPGPSDLDSLAANIFRGASPRKPFADRLAEIRYVAQAFQIEELNELLSGAALVADRPVVEVATNAPAYQLVAAHSTTPAGWRGLLAVFSSRSGALTQIRFTSDRRLVESLLDFPERTLLWSQDQPEVFESPYYPFVRNSALAGFVRLFDRRPVILPA